MKFDNYCLNLKLVSTLTEKEQSVIHDYYRDMLNMSFEKRTEISISYFNTLSKGGYLIDIRDEKINEILDGD